MAERDDQTTTRAAHWGEIAAGLMAAVLVAWWTRPELSFHKHMLLFAAARGVLWLAATGIAGTLGMVLAGGWRGRSRAGMNAASVWMLIPPLLLLFVEGSPVLLALVTVLAAGMALCLWAVAPRKAEPDDLWSGYDAVGAGPHFAELPPSRSGAKQSALIAVCLEGAFVLLLRGDRFWGAAWLAVGSLLLAWKTLRSRARPNRASARTRLSGSALSALAAVVLVLLLRPHFGIAGGAGGPASAHAQAREKKAAGVAVGDAYRGIVLFTVPEKKQVLPPVPVEKSLLHTGASRPVVIPFDGSYWYFQAPHHDPGLHPHLAHGDPVKMNIYSTGWVPLAMQAHQTLKQPIPVSGGEQFELSLRNGDNREGRIEVGVLLTNSRGPGLLPSEKPTQVLDVKPMLTSEPPEFTYKASPVDEDLTFTIPRHPAVREFDTITVLFLPTGPRDTMGARVGIRQFELLPR